MNILVSACLLGVDCKYSGGNNAHAGVLALANAGAHTLIPVCPECYGGLPTPRLPSERCGDRVIAQDGTDVTAQFERGAQQALLLAQTFDCETAILKARSPSCGAHEIYDGTFSGRCIPGEGVTAALLRAHGIRVLTEHEWEAL